MDPITEALENLAEANERIRGILDNPDYIKFKGELNHHERTIKEVQKTITENFTEGSEPVTAHGYTVSWKESSRRTIGNRDVTNIKAQLGTANLLAYLDQIIKQTEAVKTLGQMKDLEKTDVWPDVERILNIHKPKSVTIEGVG
jgi:hypothetical protein